MHIRVLYSCHTCGLRKVPCDVPARGEEDINAWMQQLIERLAADHKRRSPECSPADGALQDVMIPIAGATKVGGPVIQ